MKELSKVQPLVWEQKKEEDVQEFYILRKLIRRSKNTFYLHLPQEMVDYLNISEGEQLKIFPTSGKYGKFLAIWSNNQRR